MGSYLSRFRKKPSSSERLAAITLEIREIEEKRSNMERWEKKVVSGFMTYSIGIYVMAATVYFFFLIPPTPQEKLLYSCPVFVIPFLIYGVKRLFNWYYGGKLKREHGRLLDLYKEKTKVIEAVMETETFKVARELLEKYAPEQLRRLAKDDTENKPDVNRSILSSPLGSTAGINSGLRARIGPQSAARQRMMTPAGPSRHQTPTNLFRGPNNPNTLRPMAGRGGLTPGPPQHPQQTPGPTPGHGYYPRGPYVGPPPGPPLPRPIPPRERGLMSRMLDAFLGEGPGSNYALICNQCMSHNGLAMKEEFLYLGWRCAYCHHLNPPRKIKPMAPRLPEPPPVPETPSSVQARSESLPGTPRPKRDTSVPRTTSESNLNESSRTATTSDSESAEDGGGDRMGGEEEEEEGHVGEDGGGERQRAGENAAEAEVYEEPPVAHAENVNDLEEMEMEDDDGESGVDLSEGPSPSNAVIGGGNLAGNEGDNSHQLSPEEGSSS